MQVNQSNGSTATPADAAYADAVYRTSVEEGARDLAVIEALLQSSQSASKTVPSHRSPIQAFRLALLN